MFFEFRCGLNNLVLNSSEYIFGGSAPTGIVTTGFSSGFTPQADYGWDQEADGIIFGASGAVNLTLAGGVNYNGQTSLTTSGALTASIGEISDGYSLFGECSYKSNKDLDNGADFYAVIFF